MPGLPVYHQLPEFTQTHVHWVSDAIQPSHPVIPFSSCPQSLPASGSFPMSQFLTSGGQSIGVSASKSVLPMNTQDWSPLGWTGWPPWSPKSSATPQFSSVQLVTQSCPTLCDPMNCSMPGLPVHHQLLALTQTYVHRVGDAIQPSHPLSLPSLFASNLSQHQDLFQWVSSSHQVAKVLEFQLQHQSLQWTPRTDPL